MTVPDHSHTSGRTAAWNPSHILMWRLLERWWWRGGRREGGDGGRVSHSPACMFDDRRLDPPRLDLCKVQRAEYWGVVVVLQAFSGFHVGIDDLSVLRLAVVQPTLRFWSMIPSKFPKVKVTLVCFGCRWMCPTG